MTAKTITIDLQALLQQHGGAHVRARRGSGGRTGTILVRVSEDEKERFGGVARAHRTTPSELAAFLVRLAAGGASSSTPKVDPRQGDLFREMPHAGSRQPSAEPSPRGKRKSSARKRSTPKPVKRARKPARKSKRPPRKPSGSKRGGK